MPNGHIDVNINKTIFRATGVGLSEDLSKRRGVPSSPESANTKLDCPPHFTNIK